MINFSAKGSSVAKGESLKDTALTLEAMGADAVIVRHSASGAPQRLAGWVRGTVVNAGDGSHEHPTQALLDSFTIRRHFGRSASSRAATPGSASRAPADGALDGLRVTIVGDVLHSRVARSNVLLLHTLGADVTLVAPPTLLPVAVGSWPCNVSYDFDSALPKSDVVMMLRVQQERMKAAYFPSVREYSRRYGLDAARMRDRELAALRASRIGFVFQQFFLAEHQSVLGNVADGLLYAGVRRGQRWRLAQQALESDAAEVAAGRRRRRGLTHVDLRGRRGRQLRVADLGQHLRDRRAGRDDQRLRGHQAARGPAAVPEQPPQVGGLGRIHRGQQPVPLPGRHLGQQVGGLA